MKHLLLLVFVIASFTMVAQDFPAPSPKAKVYQMVGLTEVEVEYSSPGKKDRTIFGDVVAYDQLWRTGANRATTISFSNKVKFGGKEVEAGKYAIFSIPGEEVITVILNTNTDQGGTGQYDEALDAARVEVPFMDTKSSVERMRFTIENTTPNGADLVFAWAEKTFVVPMEMFTEEQATANFEAKVQEFEREYALYNEAANYYLEVGNLEKAREMSEKSTALNKKFWTMHTQAKIYAAMGEKKLAKAAAEESKAMAIEADYQPYIKMNDDLIESLK
jgi:hypothetical protein